MKRFFLFSVMCLFGLFSQINAQTMVELAIGAEGTTGSANVPAYEYYNYSISQQIYTAAEMQGMVGSITSIAFKQYDSAVKTRNLSVYLLNTSKDAFIGYTDWASVPLENLVFSGTVTYPGVPGEWMKLEFQTPFEYTGENLLVCVCDNTGSYVSTANFYTYDSGVEKRALYAFRDSYSFNPTNPGVYGSYEINWSTGNGRKNQVMFGITIQGEFKPLTVKPEELNLGARPNGAWMRPFAVTVGTRGNNLNVAAVETTNSYFKLPEMEMPTLVTRQEPLSFGIDHSMGDGEVEGQLAISYGEERSIELIDMTAFAYSPSTNDVWETASTINNYPFSTTPNLENIYDNYLLPGDGEDGKDVVYKMNFNNDIVLSADVTGDDAKIALYREGFEGEGGPMEANNYNGPEVGYAPIPAATSFYYDFENVSLNGWRSIDADGDGYEWETSYYLLGGWGYAHDSYFSAVSQSYAYMNLNPDNYLATVDKYAIHPESELTFWASTAALFQGEHYGVAVSTDGENFTTIWEETFGEAGRGERTRDEENGLADWKKITVALGEYAGQEVYIAIRHFNCSGQYLLLVDDIKLSKYASKRSNSIANMTVPAGVYYIAASSTSDFTVNVNAQTIPAPEKPSYPTPYNGQKNVTDPSLSWTFGDYTIEYQLLFGTTYPPQDVYVDWTNNLEIEHVIRDLYHNKNYFWQVNTRNSSGTTYGDVWVFTTTFNVPTDLAVENANLYEGESTVLTWKAVQDRAMIGYNVYVNGEKHNDEPIVGTSYTLENLPYNMNSHYITVTAVYDEGESAYSSPAFVYVTGMSSISGNFYEQDGVTPIGNGTVSLVGTDELGNPASYTFQADENGAYSGEILAGDYIATASVVFYQDTEVSFKSAYDVNSVVNFSMFEVYNPVKYITAKVVGTDPNPEQPEDPDQPDPEDPEDPEDPDQPEVTQYRIKSVATNKYITVFDTQSHPDGPVGGVGVADYTEDNSQLFTLEENGTQVYLLSANGNYIKCWSWNVDAYSTNDKTALEMVDAGNDTFYIKNTDNSKYFKVEWVDALMYIFGDCDGSNGTIETWALEPVESREGEDPFGVEVAWGMQRYGNAGDDFETGDFSVNEWNNEVSSYPWAITENAYEGSYAMKSTCEGVNSGVSAIEITVDAPYDAIMSFYHKVSSEYGWDFGYFYIDGTIMASVSSETDWSYKKFRVSEGVHTYRWEYAKDGSYDEGLDAYFVDNVILYQEPEPFTGGWITYDDGMFATCIGTGAPSPVYWGATFPYASEYAGYTINKLSVFDAPDSGVSGSANATANVYLGGTTAPETLVSTTSFTFTGCNDYVEIELETPVTVDGTQPIWVIFYCDELNYPAAGCAHTGDVNSDWLSLDGVEWGHSPEFGVAYTWMVAAHLTNAKGQTAVFTTSSKAPKFEGGASTGEFVANANATPRYVGSVAGETETMNAGTRAFASYNIYKRNIHTNVVEQLFEKTNDTTYFDSAWATDEAGVYQWGASAVYEGNRGMDIIFKEDFEGGAMPEGWTNANGQWRVDSNVDFGYVGSVVTAPQGSYYAISNGIAYYGEYYLISPSMSIKPNSVLTMSYSNRTWGADPCILDVRFSESIDGPWTTLWTSGTAFNEWNKWENITIDLSAVSGKTGYIAFVNVDRWGHYLAIDDVVVSAEVPESEITWSKPIDKNMTTTVTVSAVTDNGDPVKGTKVNFINLVEEGMDVAVSLDDTGVVTIEDFRKGTYELTISKDGYFTSVEAEVVEIWEASEFNAFLTEILASVEDLYVSPTGWAMWKGKGIGSGDEFFFDFEDGTLNGFVTIDADGDGFNWNNSMNFVTSPGYDNSLAFAYSQSYDNYTGPLYPDNYMVTADKYAIGGSSQLTFYVCAQDENWAAEHYGVAISTTGNTSAADFTTIWEETLGSKSGTRSGEKQSAWQQKTIDLSEYAGEEVYIAIRHFNCSDMFYLDIDNVALVNASKDNRALIKYQVLLDGVVEDDSVVVPYYQHENLMDSVEYTTTVIATYTMGDSEEMSYTWVKASEDNFAPVSELAAEYLNEEVVVSWTLPKEEIIPDETSVKFDFDDGTLNGWVTVDGDGDGYSWLSSSEVLEPGSGHGGSDHFALSQSYINYVGALNPDNYLATAQKYPITEGSKISFFACAQDEGYPYEHFGVAVSTGVNTSADDFTTIAEWTIGAKGDRHGERGLRQSTWTRYEADLSAYAGQEVYIAIRHFNCTDQFYLDIDDVEIVSGGSGTEGGEGITWSFDNDIEGWTTINANGDEHIWYHSTEAANHSTGAAEPHSGAGHMMSESYCNLTWSPIQVDDYLVSPQQFNVTDGSRFTFWACSQDSEYSAEHFGVAVSTAGNTSADDFTTVAEWTIGSKNDTASKSGKRGAKGSQTAWVQYSVDLSEYAGQNVWVAIRHFNCYDQFILLVDDAAYIDGATDKARDTKEGTWAYYDDGNYIDGIGGPQSFSWGIKLRAADIEDLGSLTKIAAFDRVATSGTFDICLGGDNEPGASVLNQAYSFTGIEDFVEIELTEAIDPEGQNVWIIFNTNDGTNYPAAECANTGDADGRWIYLDGNGWFDVLTGAGIDATWMIRGYFEEVENENEAVEPIAEILGVMMYKNGELVSSKPIAGESYTDKDGQIGDEYCVKVVYGGELDYTYYAMSRAKCADAEFNLDCEAPKDLYAEAIDNDVTLKLSYNPNPVGEWLYYDNGVNEDAIGGPESFYWGIMFPAASLEAYEGTSITKVALFDYAASSGNINIYYGGSSAPQDLIHTQPYSVTGTGDFVEFDLTAALPIDPTMNVWVAFSTSQGASYPAAVCADMGDPNSRWISMDGVVWEDLAGYGLNNTWMMRAYVTNAKGEISSLTPITDYEYTTGVGEVKASGVAKATSNLSHYNVYRGTSVNNLEKIGESSSKTYVDEDLADGTYYYQMTAVYAANGEECESDPANAYGSDENYVVVDVTAIDENGVKGMMVYPNPTQGDLNISAEGISRIVITNALGQVLYDQVVNADSKVINMSQYEGGVYMVRIVTENGVAIERITVVK